MIPSKIKAFRNAPICVLESFFIPIFTKKTVVKPIIIIYATFFRRVNVGDITGISVRRRQIKMMTNIELIVGVFVFLFITLNNKP